MFQFPALARYTYVFSAAYSRKSGFPHSDISGSSLSRQLTEAFRSSSRPSSPPSAKASPVRPYSLTLILARLFTRQCLSLLAQFCYMYLIFKERENLRSLKTEQKVDS